MAIQLAQKKDFGNEFDYGNIEAEKYHVNVDDTTVTRDLATGVISSLALPLPVPHVETLGGGADLLGGFGRDGNAITMRNHLQVRLIGVPFQYFDPAYQLKVFLFRYVRTRFNHHVTGVYRSGEKRPTGMVHPRHEMPNQFFGNQPTEFTFPTLADKEKLTIPDQAFTRWFQRRNYRKVDYNVGVLASILSLMYHNGRIFSDSHDTQFVEGRRRVSAIPTKGRFEFRYAITNPANGKIIYSAPSRSVIVHPPITPVIPMGGTFELTPNIKADNVFALKIDFW